MPDWSYQTVFKPLLFLMPPAAARDFALSCMGRLAQLPLGTAVIDFMGHMRPDSRLQCSVGNLTFPSRVGLGARIDPALVATRAFAQFGAGFLEIGPFTLEPIPGGPIERDDSQETLLFRQPEENPGLTAAIRVLQQVHGVPILVRIDCSTYPQSTASEAATFIDRLHPYADGFILECDNFASDGDAIQGLAELVKARGSRVALVALPVDLAPEKRKFIPELLARGVIDGLCVEGGIPASDGSYRIGTVTFKTTLWAVESWRSLLPPETRIIASGGIHEPRQALELMDAGCDLVRIDSGLIFTGPGLVKRINEALLYRQLQPLEPQPHPERYSWFWTGLMGLGMFLGGILALIIAATRVVMPYDESMSGLTREQLLAINDRLLHFMAHDRVTLAGTMLAVGILFLALSVCGSRRGMHWARRTIAVSASAGFASFFLFLGFGYFDPFHAFVTAVLFQLLIMAVHADLPTYTNPIAPELTNDRAWHLSQWGQLIFIVHGAVILVAGCVIAGVGITSVFVPEDLEFMHTTAEHLTGAHPRLVPLIAHDRATFGGMLISTGVCVLLSSLWGFRRGHGWLWWALVLAGSAAYIATILIHWHVGYTSLHHLLPAYAGLAMLFVGAALCRRHLCRQT